MPSLTLPGPALLQPLLLGLARPFLLKSLLRVQASTLHLACALSCSNDQIGVQNTIGAINAVTIFLGALYSLNVSRHSMLCEAA